MKSILKITFLITCFFMTSCSENEETLNNNELLLWVDSEKVDCTGLADQKCYLIQDGSKEVSENWEYYYDAIIDFDANYEEGFIYKISVLKTIIENPAQGQSSFHYTLVNVISKTIAQ